MKQILFSECIPNFLLYECFAMHMMTCQVLVLGQNTRGVTGPAYVVWSGIPSWVIIGSNRRCSSVMEAQLTVHHRS